MLDETSQSSVTRTNLEMSALDLIKDVTAETLFEYKWPLEGKHSEHYFLQEQVSEYLGVKSFKRRYPVVDRRKINHDERDFLVEMRAVNETQVGGVLFQDSRKIVFLVVVKRVVSNNKILICRRTWDLQPSPQGTFWISCQGTFTKSTKNTWPSSLREKIAPFDNQPTRPLCLLNATN